MDTPSDSLNVSSGANTRLKSFRAKNFKSFDEIQLEFGANISTVAILGANGSGKSNILDAIMYGLGENNLRSLRVNRLDKLLYNETRGLQTDEDSSATSDLVARGEVESCTVELVVDFENQEVKMERSNAVNGRSIYMCNDQNFSYRDYTMRLRNMGLNFKARNFVAIQGTILNIAWMTAQQLSELLEITAGSHVIKPRYDEVSKQEEEISMQVSQAMNEWRYDQKFVSMGTRQVHNLKQFEKLTAKLKSTVEKVYLFNIHQLNLTIGQYEARKPEIEHEIHRSNATLQNCDEQITKLRDSVKNFENTVFGLRQQLSSYQKELDQKKITELQLKEQEKCVLQEIDNKMQATADYEKSKIINREKLQKANADMLRLRGELSTAENQRDQQRINADMIAEYRKLKNTKFVTPNNTTVQCELVHNLRAYQELVKENFEELSSRLTEKIQSAETKRRQMIENLGGLRQQEVAKENHLKELELEELVLNTELEDTYECLLQAKMEETQNQHENAIAELGDLPGVMGTFSELCDVKHKAQYQHAAHTYLSIISAEKTVVVCDNETVDLCKLQLFADMENAVQVSRRFLVLDQVPHSEESTTLANVADSILMSRVLTCDNRLHPALLHVCDNTIVINTSDVDEVAILSHELGRKMNVISTSGIFFGKNGVVCSNFRENRQESQRVQEEILEAETEKVSLINQLDIVENKQRVAKDELKLIQNEITVIEISLENSEVADEFQPQLAQIDEQLVSVEDCLQSISELLEEYEAARESESESDACELETFQTFLASHNFLNLEHFEDILKEQEIRDLHILKLQAEKEELSVKHKYYENLIRNATNQVKTIHEVQLTALEQKRVQIMNKLNDASLSQESEQQMHATHTALQEDILKKLANLQKVLAEKLEERNVLQRTNSRLKKDLNELSILRSKAQYERHMSYFDCKIKRITLPVTNGDFESLISHTSDSPELSNQSYFHDSQIMLDYRKLPRAHQVAMNNRQVKEVQREFDVQIEEIEGEISALGRTDVNAREKLEQFKARAAVTKNHLKELRARFLEISRDLHEVRQQRSQLFMPALDHLSNTISDIYKQLGGVMAMVFPMNPEEPYLDGLVYSCQAGNKAPDPLQLDVLSGGEKSIAALALFSSLRSYKSLPILLLDEVDAHLDEENARRWGKFLRSQRERDENLLTFVVTHNVYVAGNADKLVGIARKFDENGKVLGRKIVCVDFEDILAKKKKGG